MSQQIMISVVDSLQVEGIFTPGKVWSDSTGLVYNVEEP